MTGGQPDRYTGAETQRHIFVSRRTGALTTHQPTQTMSSIAISSLLVVLSIVAIIVLTSKVKFSVFGSLFAVSLALALGSGMPLGKVIDTLKSSFGNTLGGISFIIIFGAAIAVCMQKSGGALSIASHILKLAGKGNAKAAMPGRVSSPA